MNVFFTLAKFKISVTINGFGTKITNTFRAIPDKYGVYLTLFLFCLLFRRQENEELCAYKFDNGIVFSFLYDCREKYRKSLEGHCLYYERLGHTAR